MTENIIFAGYLMTASVFDLRSRKIPLLLIRGGLAAGVCLCVARLLTGAQCPTVQQQSGMGAPASQLAGAAYGALFLLVGLATREAMGYADGWSILLAGLYLGLPAAVFISCAALAAAAVFSILLLVLRRAGKKSSYPFLPFLGAAYCLWLFISGS